METFKTIFFENPWPVYVVLGLAELVLLFLWRSRRTSKSAIRLLYPLAAASAVFAVATLVVTLREELVLTLKQLKQDASALDVEAVAVHFGEDFRLASRGRRVDRTQAVIVCKRAIQKYGVSQVDFLDTRVETDGPVGKVELITQIWIKSDFTEKAPTMKWTFHWRHGPDGWKVIRIDQPELALYISL